MGKEAKKYRLGNQPEEYELREDYLGWAPDGECWADLCFRNAKNESIKIFQSFDGSSKILFLHHIIIKGAFPLSFLGEKRAKNWSHFAIVSDTETSGKYIIPLH